MSQPYVGEIRMFGGNYEPDGWMFCDGRLLPISEYETLFQLIGTTYGGDGESTFALPNLSSRIPLHQGTGPSGVTYQIGEMAGTEQETLTLNQIPVHSHVARAASGVGHLARPEGAVPAVQRDFPAFDSAASVSMAAGALGSVGGSQPHENVPPYLAVSFIISLFGIFPNQF